MDFSLIYLLVCENSASASAISYSAFRTCFHLE